VTDATILIPTHRHAAFLPYSLESALGQEGASVEVFVVGDGVEEPTREVIARYADDDRLRFFDRPKGPRLGEAHRHAILQEANGRIVTYLADDDLLLRDHVANVLELLEDTDSPIRSRPASTPTRRCSSFRGATAVPSSASSPETGSDPSA
jgi:glycosyltransferase involved in cell wall biosynthesis